MKFAGEIQRGQVGPEGGLCGLGTTGLPDIIAKLHCGYEIYMDKTFLKDQGFVMEEVRWLWCS